MGYKGTFLDNEEVKASELNAIVTDVGGDVTSEFTDGTTYGVDDLNRITADLVGRGVSQLDAGSLRVSVVSGSARIAPGTAFFASGGKLTVDAEGVTLPLVSGGTSYVYLVHDAVANQMVPRCGGTPPEGDCVPLAEVSAAGAVTDVRRPAIMKNPSTLPNLYQEQDVVIGFSKEDYEYHDTGISVDGYRYAYFQENNTANYVAFGIWDLLADKIWSADDSGDDHVNSGGIASTHPSTTYGGKVQNGTIWIRKYGTLSASFKYHFVIM